MNLIIDNWQDFGLPGIIIGAFFGLVIYILKDHKQERELWLDTLTESNKNVSRSLDSLTDEIRWAAHHSQQNTTHPHQDPH